MGQILFVLPYLGPWRFHAKHTGEARFGDDVLLEKSSSRLLQELDLLGRETTLGFGFGTCVRFFGWHFLGTDAADLCRNIDTAGHDHMFDERTA